MEIEWRDIPGYEGLYKVSEYGDVISLERIITFNNGNKRKIKAKLLSKKINERGYITHILCNDNGKKGYGNHILVAMAFIPNPNNLPIVKHLDNIPSHNHYTNLMWDTQKNNSIDSCNDELRNYYKGENNHLSKLKNEDILYIRNSDLKNIELAKKYNVTTDSIWRIKTKRTWNHIK